MLKLIQIIRASACTILFAFIASFVLGFGAEIAHSPAGWDGALMLAMAATILTFLSLLFWGVPAHYLLRHWKRNTLFWYAALGMLPGPVMVFVFYVFGNDTFLEKLYQSFSLGLWGAIVASVFWFFVRDKNV